MEGGSQVHEQVVLIEAVIFNVLLALGSVTLIVVALAALVRELREGHWQYTASIPTIVARVFLFIVLPAIVLTATIMGLISCHRIWIWIG